jgi:hypothetical protein
MRRDLGQPQVQPPDDERVSNASDHDRLVAYPLRALELYRVVARRDEAAAGDADGNIVERRVFRILL